MVFQQFSGDDNKFACSHLDILICRRSIRDGKKLRDEEMKELFQSLSPQPTLRQTDQDDEEKKKLYEWIDRKKAERHNDFLKRLEERRASEKNPYKSRKKVSNGNCY